MPTVETELQPKQDAVLPAVAAIPTKLMVVDRVGLEQTPEFAAWLTQKAAEVIDYVKRSFREDLPIEKLVFQPAHLGYPDPVGQLRTHARIWGYNYKIKNENGEYENVIDPATGQTMSYVVWKTLDPPVMPVEVADPDLESDTDVMSENFDAEPVAGAIA